MEAVRSGAAMGPGAAAMQAMGLGGEGPGGDLDEEAANAAAAAQVDAEMGDGGLGEVDSL